MCALRAPKPEGSNGNISALGARRFSNWDKKRVGLGGSQAEGIAGQPRSFSPLKSLQKPIDKAGLHHGEVNILIFRQAAAPGAAQSTGSGHWDLAHPSHFALPQKALDLQPGLTQAIIAFLRTRVHIQNS